MNSIKVVTGDNVYDLLQETWFQQKWDELYSQCSWATAFQSRPFVSNWYVYSMNDFLPILVYSLRDNQLEGLLAVTTPHTKSEDLELRNNRARIVGAGGYDAEYQVWISSSQEKGNDFIDKAIRKLAEAFPAHDIMFRFIPPKSPLEWLKSTKFWKTKHVLQPYARPFMEMKDPQIQKIFKKRGYKLKVNRLKRLGNLEFRKITDLEEFTDLVGELVTQYDFRQGAMFNKVSYKGKPDKTKLLIELFKASLLHVTVLYLSGEIIASIIAVKDSKWAHLGGINTHSPFYAPYSPGFIHFIMLGEQLIKDDIALFDLTPGGDAYKERLATGYDEVYELLITHSQSYFVKRRLRKLVHDKLVNSGKRPMLVELQLKRKILDTKRKAFSYKTKLANLVTRTRTSKQSVPLGSKQLKTPINIQKNSLSQLLEFEQSSTLSRWEFLETAMKNFEEGKHSFTSSIDEILMACAWVQPEGCQNGDGNTDMRLNIDQIYIHPSAPFSVQDFLDRVKEELEVSNMQSEPAN